LAIAARPNSGAASGAAGKRSLAVIIARLLNWALLLVLTAAATIWLRAAIDPYLPPGEWHGFLTGMFLFALWPLLVWSLRGLARFDPAKPYASWWW
jgi:hypothetical protein